VVWDAQSGQAVSGLDDPWHAATGRSNPRPGGVRALAWVMSDPCLLAVALTHMLIIWDPRGTPPPPPHTRPLPDRSAKSMCGFFNLTSRALSLSVAASNTVVDYVPQPLLPFPSLCKRERFTSSPTFLCGNTPATLG